MTEEKYSFHEEGHDIAKFLEHIDQLEKRYPDVTYRNISKDDGIMRHAPGNLRDEVHKARAKGIFGIWKTLDEYALLNT